LALMLLSVRERTGEIGLRMAIGARPRDILFQFLAESGILAVAGWGVGVLLGGLGTLAISIGTGWTVGIPVEAGGLALGIVVAIGVGFGALPARRAARIPPVAAIACR
ncbi:MAG: ABC transporter permease, partial [Opitutaceae bacterium]|nr:ABC transporter permease [Opitutaceae bacterium]